MAYALLCHVNPQDLKVRELVERIKLAGQSFQILVLREGEIKKLLA